MFLCKSREKLFIFFKRTKYEESKDLSFNDLFSKQTICSRKRFNLLVFRHVLLSGGLDDQVGGGGTRSEIAPEKEKEIGGQKYSPPPSTLAAEFLF